jgi:TusA-related sulfurtransferase
VTKKIWVSFLIILSLVLFAAWLVYACGNSSGCAKKSDCPATMKDAKVEVTNLDNGITMSITSDNPEAVKQIQKHKKEYQCCGLKGTKSESKKTDNGIVMTITSKDPEVVKQIQALHANCMSSSQSQSSTTCPGKTGGKCPGMMTGCPKSGTK